MAKSTDCKERLTQLFDNLGKQDIAIATDLGVSKQTISAWRTGVRSPKRTMIEHISNVYGVSIPWLMGYDVPMTDSLPSGLIPIADLQRHRIPVLGSMAAGEPIYDEEFPDVVVDGPLDADFALRVKGDSMEPTYLNDDLVFLKSTPDLPHDGAVCAIAIDDEATLKHVYRHPDSIVLTSNNSAYGPMMYAFQEHKIQILGVPVGFLRMCK